MKDFVSDRMLGGVALITATTIAWAVFVSRDLAWPALVTVSVVSCLAAAAAYWRSTQSQHSIAQILACVEAEPVLHVATDPAGRLSRGVRRP